jgi:fucose permease
LITTQDEKKTSKFVSMFWATTTICKALAIQIMAKYGTNIAYLFNSITSILSL